jgi:hypothetical protein
VELRRTHSIFRSSTDASHNGNVIKRDKGLRKSSIQQGTGDPVNGEHTAPLSIEGYLKKKN